MFVYDASNPKICQSLISGIQTVVHDRPGPVHSPNPILFCGTVMGTNIQNSNKVFSMQTLNTE